ncbi:MAG: formate dehydrogenase subunit gamma [Rhizomicrobium sp.]
MKAGDVNSAATRGAWSEDRARAAVAPHAAVPGGLLPALHALQAEFGFVPKPAIALLAHEFNLSRAEVFGVASFYHDFRLDGPAGRHVLKLCRAEACQAVGAERIAAAAQAALKLGWSETSSDGAWTLEPAYCLGLCASGPSAMLNGEPVGRLDETKLAELIEQAGP